MEASLVSAGAMAAKSNRMECCLGFFCHEVEVAALHSRVHGGQGEVIVGWLTGNVSETIGGEVGAKDKQFTMIKMAQARIGKDSLVHLFKSSLGVAGPVWVGKICVFVLKDNPEWGDVHLEVGDETSVELDEADKPCDVADRFRGRPHVEELVFGHGRLIVVDAYINTNNSNRLMKMCNFFRLRERFWDWHMWR
jgi:hypothetical protein